MRPHATHIAILLSDIRKEEEIPSSFGNKKRREVRTEEKIWDLFEWDPLILFSESGDQIESWKLEKHKNTAQGKEEDEEEAKAAKRRGL